MLLRALFNGVISWLVLALLFTLVKGMAFTAALLTPYVFGLAIAAAVASYVGFLLKARR